MKFNNDKKGFTLIELLIVTVVIVTLMGVVFRLAGAGSDDRAKATTIARMQRLENALSGYYAAYGSYPPVPLQGRSRSIYMKVQPDNGLQEDGPDENGETDIRSRRTMHQILAACKAQPVAVSWPVSEEDDELRRTLEALNSVRRERNASQFTLLRGVGALNYTGESNWRSTKSGETGVQLFEFGLLSFLLPRYLFMMTGGADQFYEYKRNGRYFGQWAANNQLPCRLDNGEQFESWTQVRNFLGNRGGNQNGKKEAGMISNLTSQAVCARWIPNLKGIVSTLSLPKFKNFYGTDISAPNSEGYFSTGDTMLTDKVPYKTTGEEGLIPGRRLRIYNQSGFTDSTSGGNDGYLLLSMSVFDGWGQEFFYYSEPPYQSYRLWSAGPNNVTFPPWYDLSQFSGDDLKFIKQCMEDDIVHLSN